MAIRNGLEKAFSDRRFKLFFSFVIAFVLAAAVTIDQQSKNLIKLLVVAGVLVTFINWQEIKRHASEFDMGSLVVLIVYFLSILLAIVANPINDDTLHDLRIMSIGFTSVFIWSLMVSIRFRADFFWWGILLCALSTGVYALVQVGMHGVAYRAVGSSGKPIMFGDIAMVSGVISIAALTHFRKYPSPARLIPVIAALMGILASILSGSRGGWLFLPLAIAIFLLFLNRHGSLRLSFKSILVSLSFTCAVIVFVLNYTTATQRLITAHLEIQQYISQQSDSVGKTAVGQRLEMWQASLIAFNKAPVFGIGPGAFDDHIANLAQEDLVNSQVAEAWITEGKFHPHTHAHNEYLNTLATRGLFGISTLILLFGFFLQRFFILVMSDNHSQASLGLAGILLISGYMIFSLTESVLYHAMTANFFFLSLVALMYLSRKQPASLSNSIEP
jgi:O-antigen ligase